MPVDYDPLSSTFYVQRLRQLGSDYFVRLWTYVADISEAPSHFPLQLIPFVNEWKTMSPWTKQLALFLMATEIELIARQRAKAAADRARVQDPL